MRILNLHYKDNVLNWSVESASFEKLTLLVGASGVGKTQILNSILKLKAISNGKSFSGINWQIEFTTRDERQYRWIGSFENKGELDIGELSDDDSDRVKPKIISESLFLDDNEIVSRDHSNLIFQGERTVKLPQQQSAVYLLKEEESIKPIHEGFKRVFYSDQSESQKEPFRIRIVETQKLLKKLDTIEKIRASDEDIRIKLYLAYKNAHDIFEVIKERYIDIFPQIEDVKIEPLDYDSVENLPYFFKEYPFIQIKEIGVNHWIKQENISSGMFRTLMHVSEIYLCSEGSVFLIDEFENSLGINCIDEITGDILSSKRNIQFILTSHHPYIINNIPFSYWKLVTRNKGIVKTHDAAKFNLGNSKHTAFMQLLQLEEYQTGMEA